MLDNTVTFYFERRSSGIHEAEIPDGIEDGSPEWEEWCDGIVLKCLNGELSIEDDDYSFTDWEFDTLS